MGISASLVRTGSVQETVTHPTDNNFTDFHLQEEFILSTVYPDLKSYTWESPRPGEVSQLRNLALDVSSYPHMLAFDNAFFKIFGQFDSPVQFYSRGYSFQKTFLVKLLTVILHPVCEDSEMYGQFVELFLSRYALEGVAINECKLRGIQCLEPAYHLTMNNFNHADGQIGEALVKAMVSLETLNGESEQLWARVYSRFIRAIM